MHPKQSFSLHRRYGERQVNREFAAIKASGFYRLCSILMVLLVIIGIFMLFTMPAIAVDKWAGVDEAVIEKVSKENGREAQPPLINTDKGDLLLFAFLLAGAAGGFVAGYYWRVLIEKPGTTGLVFNDEQNESGDRR